MTAPRDPGRIYADYDIRSPFRGYLRVCRDLIVEPEAFFRAIRGGSLWGPTQFVFATYLLVTLLFAPLFLLTLVLMFSRLANYPPGADSPSSFELIEVAAPFVLAPILTPFGGVFGTFVGALLWHPFVAVSVGRGHGFRETYRIGAYQSMPYVLGGLVPVFGPILSIGAMSYLGVFGVKGAHETSTTRAVVSAVVPLVLTFVLFVAAIIVVLAFATSTSR